MQQIVFETRAGAVSDELVRRGVGREVWVHAVITILDPDAPSTTIVTPPGKAADQLTGEHDPSGQAEAA